MTTNPPAVATDALPAPTSQAQLYAALAKAQGEFLTIEKNRDVTIKPRDKAAYSFRYADLQEILAKTRPALAANGLALFQTVEPTTNGTALMCRLAHASGAIVTSELPMPSPEQLGDVKQFGGIVSYLRRYLVTAILGVAADDNLDENGAAPGEGEGDPQQPAGKPAVAMPQRRTAAEATATPSPAPADAPASAPGVDPASVDATPCTTGERAYLLKKISAKGWTLAAACQAAGLEAIEAAEQLTKGYFNAIKAVV